MFKKYNLNSNYYIIFYLIIVILSFTKNYYLGFINSIGMLSMHILFLNLSFYKNIKRIFLNEFIIMPCNGFIKNIQTNVNLKSIINISNNKNNLSMFENKEYNAITIECDLLGRLIYPVSGLCIKKINGRYNIFSKNQDSFIIIDTHKKNDSNIENDTNNISEENKKSETSKFNNLIILQTKSFFKNNLSVDKINVGNHYMSLINTVVLYIPKKYSLNYSIGDQVTAGNFIAQLC